MKQNNSNQFDKEVFENNFPFWYGKQLFPQKQHLRIIAINVGRNQQLYIFVAIKRF